MVYYFKKRYSPLLFSRYRFYRRTAKPHRHYAEDFTIPRSDKCLIKTSSVDMGTEFAVNAVHQNPC